MSKPNLKAVAPVAGVPARGRKTMLSHLASFSKSFKAYNRAHPVAAAIAVVFLFSLMAVLTLGGSVVGTAMLYLLADNGKKSGRADGNVYMRNGVVRGYVTPAKVSNGYTTAARALLSQWSSSWEVLSDSERLSWVNMAWLFRSNRFGQSKIVKGKAAYVTLNTNITLIGGTPINSAPTDSGSVPQITTLTPADADQSDEDIDLVFDPALTDSGTYHMVFATNVLPAGVSRPRRSAFRFIGVINCSTSSPYDAASLYNAKFGTIWKDDAGLIGKKIYFMLRPVNFETGATGADIINYSTISA